HEDSIWLDAQLFSRVSWLYENRSSLNLDETDLWLLELYYKDFVHAGAALPEEKRERLKEINEELSSLETQFSKNVLADSNDLAIVVDDEGELVGLTSGQIAAARSAAESRGLQGKWLITMVNFTGHPLLASLENRNLREKIMKASLSKGDRGNAFDTKEIAKKMAKLRAERAALFGRSSHAEYVTSMQTSGSPENVHSMLRKIAPNALRNAKQEGADLQSRITRDGAGHQLESWDWDFYTEKVRQEKFSIDSSALKPYFELNRVLHDGVFYAAGKLFGLRFEERKDLVGYHPEVRVFEVFNEDGTPLALYLGDFFTRDSKRGGAWMNSLVNQSHLLNKKPVVVNNLNIPKPAPGEPALLTFAETTTLFHEFGHALHGMLSDVRYPRTSGTRVHRDFVEFPSQVNEMWILW
ncbi:MAG: M3 family peptidase, partial [Actinobacteria bacterium]|nr:M3 family peptidase [Actinomycetota bacterium]